MSSPRNVLFITADQWRADALGCAGNREIATPHLDRLAADGVLFRNNYANASPCAPSRAALLTGAYQHNNGVMQNGTPLDARFTNLALESRKAGYDPALFGYTDTGADPRRHHPADPILATYEAVMPGFTCEVHLPEMPLPWLAHLHRKGYDLPLDMKEVYRPVEDGAGTGAVGRGPTFAPARFAAEDGITAYLTDRVIDWLSVRRAGSWFAHVSYLRPHPPFVATRPWHDRYDPARMPRPVRAATSAAEAAQHPLADWFLRTQQQSSFWTTGAGLVRDLPDADLAQLRATYYGMVSEVDAEIGRLLSQLAGWGVLDSTLVIVTSDHGELLGDHWMLGKSGWHDTAYHVPLIVRVPERWADAARGTVATAFTEGVDVMPTVLDWLGVPIPRQCDGRSLLPFCRGEDPAGWRQEAHWEFDFRDTRTAAAGSALGVAMDTCQLAVIRDHRFKYVHFAGLPPLFFDLAADPACLVDRSGDPAFAPAVRDYAQRMLTWRMVTSWRELTHLQVGAGGVIARG